MTKEENSKEENHENNETHENNEHHEPEKEPLNTQQKKEFKNKTFREKFQHLKANITIEPILIGIIIPSMLSKLAIQNLNLEKACRVKLGYEDELCTSLVQKNGTNLTEYEKEVQKVISVIEAWKSIIQTGLPTILILFMGAWSDKTGNRKICILLPILGEIITCIANILSTYFFIEIPLEVTMVLEALFVATLGGWVMLFLGVFSYISDVTNEETRTFRVGLANLFMTASVPIGTALSGVMLQYLGYYGVFGISAIMFSITFTYGLFYLETVSKKPTAEDLEKVKEFKWFDAIGLLKETVTVAFKKRPSNQRIKIILTLLIVAIIYGPTHGEKIVLYLFVRYRLKWNAIQFSIYSTYSIITHSIGALFSISILSRRWGFPDALLCLISITSKCVGCIMIAFVRTDFDMFMVPLVEILNATTFTSLRSMSSKLVSSAELGKMNSLISLVETLAALMFDPAYSTLYFATIQIMSGAVFLFSAAVTVPSGIGLVWLYMQFQKEKREKKLADILKAEEELKPDIQKEHAELCDD